MRRRAFIAALGGAAAWPLAARAQQPGMPVVAYLTDGTPEGLEPYVAGLRRGLEESGFQEGRNFLIEYRWARGKYDALPELAAGLVRRRVTVIVTFGSEAVAVTAKAATSTIPIVAITAGDPIKRGLVASINRPGGNITVIGMFTASTNALIAKRMELLHELVPKAAIVGWLPDTHILDYDDELHDLQAAVQALGLELRVSPVAGGDEIEAVFASLVGQRADVVLETGPVFRDHSDQVIALAARNALPMMFEWREFVTAGGLLSYGTDLRDVFRQAGVYAGRILHGDKPADLPVVRPTKFDLVINLKTANALGLKIPPQLLARADEVIE
ncbi:MAG: ABC transporter substrate-binding protein [Xanthobacteraceae bacterium]